MRLPYSIRNLGYAALCGAILLPYTKAALLNAEYLRSLTPRAMKGYSIAALYDSVKEFLEDQNAWVSSIML